MIMCPSCQHSEPDGTIFCNKCGAQLVRMDTLVTHTIQTDGISTDTLALAKKRKAEAVKITGWVTLQLLDSGKILPLAEQNEFTFGRLSEGQPIMPDVDLTPYRAYESGVSRLHATLKKKENKIIITDLGSANGTFVDGKRLKADQEHELTSGNVISLGKLKIQVLFRNM